ncbi:MAG: tetratricopeptide repeat protein, partial [Planctomycetes bacterium]|nr:tetratricopeptide repeat protein [Planctomycetota bacterium]
MIGWKISRHRSSSTSQPVSSHTRLLSPPRLHSPLRVVSCLLFWLATAPGLVDGAELIRCRRAFNGGDYAGCIRIARSAIQANEYGESWPVLKAEAELATGRFESACTTIERGLKRYPSSIRLRWTGYFAFNHTHSPRRAKTLLAEINTLAERSPWRYTDVEELLTLGHAALQVGADARVVLKGFFHRAKKLDPDHVGPDIAIGNLALDKHDAELAAEVFLAAIKRFPKNPDANFGLARALARSDPKRARQALASALAANPHHAPSLLLQTERNIDAENYDGAEAILRSIQAVNPRDPNAWALRTVIAHLQNDPKGAAAWYHAAHSSWKHNPAVDHLIGKKLSQHYRFLEGAVYQRRALSFEPNFAAARIQLAQDLLRLGREREGWKHAVEAHSRDGYDAATFNLLELRDRIAKYTTLKNDGFIVRMDSREAVVYGRRVLRLLSRAKTELCRKYGLDLKHRITVEIFADENDFAVRTFGMPAVSGFLGVCFGKVITVNSPASQAEHPSNWQAVLWHEFCHVVTLHATHNKMPRWLSEGISVYEELQRDPTWGQQMTPRYRRMILNGELTPVSNLSGAFLSPASPLHLQFAYYESALVVEFLVKQYGIEALKHVLGDLAIGLPINVALERRTDPLPKLEQDFESFARRRAEEFG